MNLSIIIPALNEENFIRNSLQSAKKFNPIEIIVVDGGSFDKTKEIAVKEGAQIIESPRGRGIQLNRGASVAKGDILLFLHADAHIADAESLNIERLIDNFAGGFFKLKFDQPSLSISIVEFFANLRSRLFQLPYGDQAIFIRRDLFEKLGGFKEYPFLEDLDFLMRARKIVRFKYIPHPVVVSTRRLRKGYPLSPIIVSLRNVFIVLLFLLGISPYRLIRLYK